MHNYFSSTTIETASCSRSMFIMQVVVSTSASLTVEICKVEEVTKHDRLSIVHTHTHIHRLPWGFIIYLLFPLVSSSTFLSCRHQANCSHSFTLWSLMRTSATNCFSVSFMFIYIFRFQIFYNKDDLNIVFIAYSCMSRIFVFSSFLM